MLQKMRNKILNIGNYNYLFYLNKSLPEVYSGVINHYNKTNKISTGFNQINFESDKCLHRVLYIPEFLELPIAENSDYKKYESTEFDKGFLIDLENHNNVDAFLLEQFSSRQRKKIRASIKKLESCFDISYKFYYGEISKETFKALFDKIEIFLQKRFSQLQIQNLYLKDHDFFKENVYQFILEKRASIFVIYDGDQPIDICFSYHLDNITFNILSSFDIDYYKFRLGYIDIVKQLDWCFEHNFKILDLGRGELAYKKEWCNKIYEFNHHIFFKKDSAIDRFKAKTLMLYMNLKRKTLQSKNSENNNVIKVISALFKKKPASFSNDFNTPDFEILNIDSFDPNNPNFILIDIEDKHYEFLKKPLYDFLYSNQETKKNIKVYKSKEKNTYIFNGAHRQLEIKLI